MTLGNSKISGYDLDERLTVDPTLHGPLQLVSVQKGRKDSAQLSKVSSQRQRSIFSEYWKADPRQPHLPPSVSPITNEEEKQLSPQLRRRIIQSTYTYNYDRNPFQYFGIEEDEGKMSSTDDDDDSESLNSYERILQKNEVGFSENNRKRSATYSSLPRSVVGIEGMVLNTTSKTTQSDTVLYVKPSSTVRRLSCLRKSRFAFDSDSTASDKERRNEKCQQSVSFEATIKVHLFPSPVEKWAPTGWSNWFGGWH